MTRRTALYRSRAAVAAAAVLAGVGLLAWIGPPPTTAERLFVVEPRPPTGDGPAKTDGAVDMKKAAQP
jgi:hypothetical protein